jgi:hypothetical protein
MRARQACRTIDSTKEPCSLSSEWTSLEIAKLAVGVLTPILLFVLGVLVTRAARRVEDVQWASRTLIERRLELFEQLAPKLNDLYAFFLVLGHFREIEPPEAVKLKRELDRSFHSHSALFTPEFGERYRAFIDACFLTFTREAEDAKLRTYIDRQRRERQSWSDEWVELFAVGRESSYEEIDAAYRALMDAFALEVGARLADDSGRSWIGVFRRRSRPR